MPKITKLHLHLSKLCRKKLWLCFFFRTRCIAIETTPEHALHHQNAEASSLRDRYSFVMWPSRSQPPTAPVYSLRACGQVTAVTSPVDNVWVVNGRKELNWRSVTPHSNWHAEHTALLPLLHACFFLCNCLGNSTMTKLGSCSHEHFVVMSFNAASKSCNNTSSCIYLRYEQAISFASVNLNIVHDKVGKVARLPSTFPEARHFDLAHQESWPRRNWCEELQAGLESYIYVKGCWKIGLPVESDTVMGKAVIPR